MTASASSRRHRDPVSALFASALSGDICAEHALKELAIHDDRAAEAFCALAYVNDSAASEAGPADVAATDQTVAAVIDAITHRSRSA